MLKEMLDKVLDECKCDFETALAWCFNAKNSLSNVHGYSSYQLAFGYNPCLPVAMSDRPTAYEVSSSDIVRENLNAMHAARKAFIASESSEKIRRALSHNVRTSNDVKYYTGDSVYYKRKDSREWKGPGKVIGQDGQQVLVKHGSTYVRVHPCRVMLQSNDPISIPIGEPPVPVLRNETSVPSVPEEMISTPVVQVDQDDDDDDEYGALPSQVVADANNMHTLYGSEPAATSADDSNVGDLPTTLNTHSELKKGSSVHVKLPGSDNWNEVTLTSRAGKVGKAKKGKYKMCWNTEDVESGEKLYVDFEEVEWKLKNELVVETEDSPVVTEECLVNVTVQSVCDEQLLAAKQTEFENWKSNHVYDEVDDEGQDTISVRWVITTKLIDSKLTCKARLCARGFEEEQPFRKDSPTCSREGMRVVLAILASNSWTVNSLDVKAAFLQGKGIERLVFVKPPKEANTNKLWKLKKCVYGLADAPRQWYTKLKEELEKLGATRCKHDDGLFYVRHDNKLIGIMSCHVDDILWGGTPLFEESVISCICKVFKISKSDSKAFTHLGVDLNQNSDGSILINQESYAKSINPIELSEDEFSNKEKQLKTNQITQLRCAIGQLNWLACVTRPDIAFDVSVASSNVKKATVSNIIHVNKIISKVKNTCSCVLFPKLDLDSAQIISYSDASFNNLVNAGSQGGHIIFLTDKNGNCCPIEWKSNRIKRVVRSALAAESLACADGIESEIYWSEAIIDLIQPMHPLRKHNRIDSKSLYDNLQSTKTVNDKLLRLDISLIKENIHRNNVNVSWIKTQNNLSDILTKSGVCSKPILSTLKGGKF